MFVSEKDIEKIQNGFIEQLKALSVEYSKIIDSKNEEIRYYQSMIGHYEEAFAIIRRIAENHERITYNQEKITEDNLAMINSIKNLMVNLNENKRNPKG